MSTTAKAAQRANLRRAGTTNAPVDLCRPRSFSHGEPGEGEGNRRFALAPLG
jgi:hypothetical protein